MGLVIDTDVLILADRGKARLDLARYGEHGVAFISPNFSHFPSHLR